MNLDRRVRSIIREEMGMIHQLFLDSSTDLSPLMECCRQVQLRLDRVITLLTNDPEWSHQQPRSLNNDEDNNDETDESQNTEDMVDRIADKLWDIISEKYFDLFVDPTGMYQGQQREEVLAYNRELLKKVIDLFTPLDEIKEIVELLKDTQRQLMLNSGNGKSGELQPLQSSFIPPITNGGGSGVTDLNKVINQLRIVQSSLQSEISQLPDYSGALAAIDQAINDLSGQVSGIPDYSEQLTRIENAVGSIPNYTSRFDTIDSAIQSIPDYSNVLDTIDSNLNLMLSQFQDCCARIQSMTRRYS